MWLLPSLFYLSLNTLPILYATENSVPEEPVQFVKIVRTNLSSEGVYSPLQNEIPKNLPSVQGFTHETDAITLTQLDEEIEIRISGSLGFSSKASTLSSHAFDMHSLGDEYLYSDLLPGTHIPLLISVESSSGSTILSGFYNLSAALVTRMQNKSGNHRYKVHYELTYRVPMDQETEKLNEENNLRVSIQPVSLQP
ncbi:MAG: hypothetical protein H3C47_02060 [Candidatus Cloacimonetes bacterium]|nr:hypothetical protein [Candidatus Cloacimonadota bacterium]